MKKCRLQRQSLTLGGRFEEANVNSGHAGHGIGRWGTCTGADGGGGAVPVHCCCRSSLHGGSVVDSAWCRCPARSRWPSGPQDRPLRLGTKHNRAGPLGGPLFACIRGVLWISSWAVILVEPCDLQTLRGFSG